MVACGTGLGIGVKTVEFKFEFASNLAYGILRMIAFVGAWIMGFEYSYQYTSTRRQACGTFQSYYCQHFDTFYCLAVPESSTTERRALTLIASFVYACYPYTVHIMILSVSSLLFSPLVTPHSLLPFSPTTFKNA